MNSPEVNQQAQAWFNFKGGEWQTRIDVRDFIQKNYSPYAGDDSFLAPATERTRQLWSEISRLIEQERLKGVLDVSSEIGSSITAHKPGYINKPLERIVGLQTDAPLKRAIVPNGGLRMVEAGLEAYGFELGEAVKT
ncbi:MAG: formate acetyltransferase, partial [Zetaproteobacteria bacterium CG_4_8_14_3_um_filter_59_5]